MDSCNSIAFRTALVALSLGFVAARASAAVTVAPVADAFITIHPTLGGASSNHGSDTSLFVISPNEANDDPVFTASMVRFDLSGYAEQIVQGAATLSMYVQGTNFNNNGVPDRTITLRDIAGTWNEATVTANNASFVPGAVIDQQSIHYLTSADDGYVSWTLPAAYVQSWIDAPATNDGLFVQNLSGGPLNDLQFGSRESEHVPQLTFNTVPEPASLGLIAVAGAGLIARRRRFDRSMR